MSGETDERPSSWTVDTVHSEVLRLFEERDRRFDERSHLAAERADLLRTILETRLTAMDKATELLSATVNQVPTDVDKQVAHLKSLHGEIFSSIWRALADRDISIDTRFSERDTRSEREARDNKIAVDAAFAAAKEAVAENNKSSALANDKSEATFTKQIDGIQLLIQTSNKAIDEKIDDLKARVDRGEGGRNGATEYRTESRLDNAQIIAVISALAVIASIVVAVLLATRH